MPQRSCNVTLMVNPTSSYTIDTFWSDSGPTFTRTTEQPHWHEQPNNRKTDLVTWLFCWPSPPEFLGVTTMTHANHIPVALWVICGQPIVFSVTQYVSSWKKCIVIPIMEIWCRFNFFLIPFSIIWLISVMLPLDYARALWQHMIITEKNNK